MSDPAIAFDITPLQNAHRFRGIGTYVRGLASRLAAQNEVPIEFWGWTGMSDVIATPPPHRLLALRRLPMPEYRGAWAFAQLAMRRRAAMSKALAIHITDPNSLRGLPRRKLMATVYDLIPLHQGFRRRSVLNRVGYRVYLNGLRETDLLFAISDQTAQDLRRLLQIPGERVVVARPGIDLPATTPATDNPQERPYFLFVGGPNPNKNLSVVLDAMAATRDLPQELLVAGHWLPGQVVALEVELVARDLREKVRHLGFVSDGDIVRLMHDATALLVPSLEEGFGLPVGEGLAAGAVVIHSNITVLNEVAAGAGLAFDPRSAEDLARCLRRVATDPGFSDELRRRGLVRARDLTWDEALRATLDAYKKVVPQ